MRRALVIAGAFLIAAALLALVLLGCGCGGSTAITAARFEALRDDPTALRAFLGRMPKGADLHVHLSGAVYAKDLLRWGKDYQDSEGRGLCFSIADKKLVTPPCSYDKAPPIADALNQQGLYDDIVNALSMRNFIPSTDQPSDHDQFFSAFEKFGEATWHVPAAMTATMLRRYAAEQVQHTELMITLTPPKPMLTSELLAQVKAASDPAAKLAVLKDYIVAAVPNATVTIDKWQASVADQLKCKSAEAEPGCKVSYRYIAQVNRLSAPEKVFANTALAAALARADRRVAGLNFVGPEDYRVARADYREHMKTIGFLTKKTDAAKEVPVALHAGELWIGLVPPDDLAFHIGDAVATAGAKRIGHGVALAFEQDSAKLLADMARKRVAVESNLTSNDVILGVRGKDHPLMAYRAAQVPVVLSTDDAGVSRIDLTNEYFRAARDYPLGYRALKQIANNSIEYSFLDAEGKRDAIKQLDDSFRVFERETAAGHAFLANLGTLIGGWFRSP